MPTTETRKCPACGGDGLQIYGDRQPAVRTCHVCGGTGASVDQPLPVVRSGAWLGVDQIRAERERQKEREGWGDEHDDGHRLGELVSAATCYMAAAQAQVVEKETDVPCSPVEELLREPGWWKPSADPIRNLVKAGALIAAEIDRLDRERSKTPNVRISDGEPKTPKL